MSRHERSTPAYDPRRGLEECADEVSEALECVASYPARLLALALRAHLGALLQELVQAGECTPAEVDLFVRQLALEARLQPYE